MIDSYSLMLCCVVYVGCSMCTKWKVYIFPPVVNHTLTCFFSLQLLEAMYQDSGIPLKSIQVDGGMTANNLLMQLQADLMGIDVGE